MNASHATLLILFIVILTACSTQNVPVTDISQQQEEVANARTNELSTLQKTCAQWEIQFNNRAVEEGLEEQMVKCEAQENSCLCKFASPTKTLLGTRIIPLSEGKSTFTLICLDNKEVKTASDCDYLGNSTSTAGSSQTTTWTKEVPTSPTACKVCDIEPLVYDNYDHMYRPGWNQTCHDKIMDCLIGIYGERQKEGIVDPMCDKKGHNCLCFDGYPKSKDRQAGPYKCYLGLAQRLCDDKVTQEYCNAYSTYFPVDVTQDCLQQVGAVCNPVPEVDKCSNPVDGDTRVICNAEAAIKSNDMSGCEKLTVVSEVEMCKYRYVLYKPTASSAKDICETLPEDMKLACSWRIGTQGQDVSACENIPTSQTNYITATLNCPSCEIGLRRANMDRDECYDVYLANAPADVKASIDANFCNKYTGQLKRDYCMKQYAES